MKKKTPTEHPKIVEEFTPQLDKFRGARQISSWMWILRHLIHGSNSFLFFLAIMATIISAIFSSLMYVTIGQAITEFQTGFYHNLLRFTLLIAVYSMGGPAINLIHNFTRELIAQRMERDVRKEFLSNLLGKSQSFHERQRVGDIMARATEDVRMLNYLVSPGISLLIQGGINIVIPIIIIAQFYPSILLVTPVSFTILFLIAIKIYSIQLGPATTQLREEFGNIEATLTESVSGIEVIKSLVREKEARSKILERADKYRQAYIQRAIVEGRYIPFLIYGVALVGGLLHGVILYRLNLMELGEIIAFVGILFNLRFPTFISVWVVALIRMAVSGADRILETMNQTTEIGENIQGVNQKIQGTIEFRNVSFTYPGATKPILKNISFKMEAGKTVAIVGTTGSGKTTLIKLISRLYDVSDGEILIDGIDVRDYALHSLRNQIAFIEQDIYLFSASIQENIAFGRTISEPATEEEIIKVAQAAQAHEFIMRIPNQYQAEIGERGVQLSGGERQRIAIARALLADPRILIVDDATSAIDSRTEEMIQRAFKSALKDRTTFLITHRLSQIRWADLIIVMKKGEIVAQGNHKTLMETSPEYREIFIKKFDLDIPRLKECI